MSEKTICGFIPVFLSSIVWPSLPQISLTSLAVFILVLFIKYRFPAILTGMICGFVWASICGHYYLNWQLDPKLYHHNLVIEGEVASLMPITKIKSLTQTINKTPNSGSQNTTQTNESAGNGQIKFNFILHKAGTKILPFSPRIRLSWFASPLPLQQGDKLRLFVKLKPSIGLANPDGFDYQTWLTSKNIVGLGYVKTSPSNQFIVRQSTFRQQWVNKLLSYDVSHIKWILALSYGDRHLLQKQDWDLMQRTGTAHLFAISGMHLGIVFGCVLLLCKGLCVVAILSSNHSMTINIKPWLLVFPSAICIGYALIAGYEVPVLRALFTVLLWTVLVLCSQYWRTPNVLIILLMSFFILFPFAILGISFWFSFISVLIIILYIWRFPLAPNSSFITKLIFAVKLQLFISLVTLPMIAYTFSSLPITAFIANLFMIPMVTFILVPLCLLAAILISVGFQINFLYGLINECFSVTFWVLIRLDSMSVKLLGDNWQHRPAFELIISSISSPLTVLLMIIVILPGWPKKRVLVASILCLSIFHKSIQSYFRQADSAWTFYAMDVGQGTALVVSDKLGTMLSDTGGSFAGFSMAETVLIPFFDAHRITTLEYVLLSHFDNDHAGGIELISEKLKVNNLYSPRAGCNREDFLLNNPSGKAKFMTFTVQVLWPLMANSGNENNQSCVIKLEKDQHSILLTGDIEKQAEAQIVAKYLGTTALKADILVAPHHGSKTSSTPDFVEAVWPKIVIFTSGNQNRWGFPSPMIVKRYQSINAEVLITGEHGRIKLDIDESRISVSRYRIDEYNRWYYKAR